jgi:hypothetical protein
MASPNDTYLLRTGFGGVSGPLTNIDEGGFAAASFHSFEDTLQVLFDSSYNSVKLIIQRTFSVGRLFRRLRSEFCRSCDGPGRIYREHA